MLRSPDKNNVHTNMVPNPTSAVLSELIFVLSDFSCAGTRLGSRNTLRHKKCLLQQLQFLNLVVAFLKIPMLVISGTFLISGSSTHFTEPRNMIAFLYF